MPRTLFTETLQQRMPLIALTILLVAAGIAIAHTATTAIAEIERRDPLFDFPGANPEELRGIAAGVREAERAAHEAHPELSGQRIYPVRFWFAVAELRRARDRFLDQPSWISALGLFGGEARTVRAYQRDVAAFRRTFENARTLSQGRVPDDMIFPYLPGVAVDIASYRAALRLFVANGNALEAAVKQRVGCVLTGICSGRTERQKSWPSPVDTVSLSKLLPDTESAFLRDLLMAKQISPRIFVYTTPCFNSGLHAAAFTLWQREFPNGTNVLYPKLATNSFFRKATATPLLHPDAYRASTGAYYMWQPETNFYTCTDLGYYPALATMAELVRRALGEPLASALGSELEPDMAARLQSSEYALATTPVVSIALIGEYLAALDAAVSSLGGRGSNVLATATEARIHLWKTQSGDLASVFAQLEPEILRYASFVAPHAKAAPPITFVLSRGYPSLLFAQWNESVWRLSGEPQFAFADEVPRNIYTGYWELLEQFGSHQIHEIERRSLIGSHESSRP